jgi:hypothetical protein
MSNAVLSESNIDFSIVAPSSAGNFQPPRLGRKTGFFQRLPFQCRRNGFPRPTKSKSLAGVKNGRHFLGSIEAAGAAGTFASTAAPIAATPRRRRYRPGHTKIDCLATGNGFFHRVASRYAAMEHYRRRGPKFSDFPCVVGLQPSPAHHCASFFTKNGARITLTPSRLPPDPDSRHSSNIISSASLHYTSERQFC